MNGYALCACLEMSYFLNLERNGSAMLVLTIENGSSAGTSCVLNH